MGDAIMTPEHIKSIRHNADLSVRGLMSILRIRDRKTVMRWETGEVPVTGPASVILEMIESGELPARYYPETRR